MISIKTEETRIKHLKEQIKQYELLIEDGEDTIEVRQMREWIEREARKLGYKYTLD